MPAHVVSPKTYSAVYLALLVLLVLTVALAELPLAEFHLTVALGIAALKAMLIVLYFMHVRYSPSVLRLFSFAALLWLLLLIALTMADRATRMTNSVYSSVQRSEDTDLQARLSLLHPPIRDVARLARKDETAQEGFIRLKRTESGGARRF